MAQVTETERARWFCRAASPKRPHRRKPAFSEWERIFANPMTTSAAIDRVVALPQSKGC